MATGVLYQTRTKTTTRLNLPWHTTWAFQKRSSRKRYESSSRHAFIIGARSKGIIGMFLYSKACRKCDSAEKRVEEAKEYECPYKFEGSSKNIEASAILKMVEDAFYNIFSILDVIVSDDDIIMWVVPKHPLINVWGQVMKTSKGKLDEEIPEPSFIADPSHRVKVVAKHIFFIVNESRAQQCGCTKVDTLWINKYWGYMIKNNRDKTIEELIEASKVPLEHMFNSHDNCSAEWCFETRQEHQKK